MSLGWGIVLSAAAGYAQSRSQRSSMREQMAMTTEQMELQREWDKEDRELDKQEAEERRQRMSEGFDKWRAYGPGGDKNTMWGEENALPKGFVGGLLASNQANRPVHRGRGY